MMNDHGLNFILRKDIREGLSEKALKTLFTSMEKTSFMAGERLITRGEKGDRLFIVQEGTCRVIIEKDGTDLPIVSLNPGDLAGEMALITGEPRTAHVDAETDVVVLEISREKFDVACDDHPAMHEILSKIIEENIYSSIFREQREVGKYTIQKLLRKGKFSNVYKGVYRHINMPVAVKMLGHEITMNPDFLNNFKADAVKILQMNHENLVTVFDIVGLYRTIFIFMEYLEGESLSSLLNRMPQPPLDVAVEILLQTCSGLAVSHDHGLIHKQMDPSNIFVMPGNQVKLIDFGLAPPVGATEASLGKRVFYMSSEQINKECPDERSDIYSLGITAFEMLTGQRPFLDDDINKFWETHATWEIPDPRSLRPDLPDELCRIVIKASQKSPDKRYKNVSEIINDLKHIKGDLDIR